MMSYFLKCGSRIDKDATFYPKCAHAKRKETRKAAAWHIDRAVLPIMLLLVSIAGVLFSSQISEFLDDQLETTFNWTPFLIVGFALLITFSIFKIVKSLCDENFWIKFT